jgi:hypothetical protein
VCWDTDLYSALLPELGAAASRFEHLYGLQDPLLSRIIATLAEEIEGDFADRILVESLGTALCIRIARRFVGRLPLPTSNKGPRQSGCGACAITSRRISMTTSRSLFSPISPV